MGTRSTTFQERLFDDDVIFTEITPEVIANLVTLLTKMQSVPLCSDTFRCV